MDLRVSGACADVSTVATVTQSGFATVLDPGVLAESLEKEGGVQERCRCNFVGNDTCAACVLDFGSVAT